MTTLLMFMLCLLIGWIMDLSGLYFAIKCKESNKIFLSKCGYFTMRLGEVVTTTSLVFVAVTITYLVIN